MNEAALKSAKEIAAQAVVLQVAYGQRTLFGFKQHPHLIVIANSDATLEELAIAPRQWARSICNSMVGSGCTAEKAKDSALDPITFVWQKPSWTARNPWEMLGPGKQLA